MRTPTSPEPAGRLATVSPSLARATPLHCHPPRACCHCTLLPARRCHRLTSLATPPSSNARLPPHPAAGRSRPAPLDLCKPTSACPPGLLCTGSRRQPGNNRHRLSLRRPRFPLAVRPARSSGRGWPHLRMRSPLRNRGSHMPSRGCAPNRCAVDSTAARAPPGPMPASAKPHLRLPPP